VFTKEAFDLDRPWCLDGRVALRPEPFGALLYHFGTRKLSFLKNHTIVTVIDSLEEHADARSACRAAGIAEGQLGPYLRALETLVTLNMLVPR